MRMSDWSSDVCSSDLLENILGVTAKLAFIQRLALPRDFLSVTGKAWVDQIVRRVAGEKASEMRRHVPARQLGLYAVYLMAREAQLTDRSEEHTSELPSLMRITYDVFCLKNKTTTNHATHRD